MADLLARLQSALADRYTIERELGAGGMAMVYLAQDQKLGRAVALKVLRPELAAVLGGDRFLREIEIAAKLAHPHILGLFDCGQADGLLYYTMPFVEGESLRDRLTRERQLPLDDALQIAREVADALGYAHALGLVHRDIKPENILFEAGHAVVSDFGIARAVSAAGTARLTETGLAIGTPAYMSPEQAAGSKDVDGRSDLYSLGCVLYEMLSGDPPFYASTPQAVLAKKLSEPLPRISVVREAVPASIEATLTKAMARTPADRFTTTSQFAEALAHPEAMPTPSGGTAATEARPPRTLGRLPRWAKWGTGLAAVAVVVLVVSQLLKPKPLSITASDIVQVTSEPGVEFQPAISPDGKEVAYVAGRMGNPPHLVIRSTVNVAGGGEVRLADTSLRGEWLPSWSRDGDFVRFFACRAGDCAWSETGRLAGAVRPLVLPQRALKQSRYGFPAWTPDGARVAFVAADTIFVSSTADTTPRRVTVHSGATSFWGLHSLAWSPNGKLIAYVNKNPEWPFSGNFAPSEIWIADAGGGVPRQIAGQGFLNVSPTWLDARHLLFVSNRDGPRGMYVVEVGPQGRRGEPRGIPGVADPHSISYSIAARKLAYAKFTLRQNIWAYPLGRSTPISIKDGQPVTSGNQVIEVSDVSPDGRWLAFDSDRRGNMDLYKVSLGGGDPVPLTALPGGEANPRWSPDGTEIAFSASATVDSISHIMVMPAGGGAPSLVTDGVFPTWSPTGLAIAFQSNRTGSRRIWLVSRDSVGGTWHEAVQLTDFLSIVPDWAPDGSGVLCVAEGGNLVLVSPQGRVLRRLNVVPTSELAKFGYPRYARDGRTVYVTGTHRDGQSGVWAIPATGGRARLIVASDDPVLSLSVSTAPPISVGPDRLYLTVSQYESDIWVMNLRW